MAHILLFEDHSFSASLISTVLREIGHTVSWYKNGRDGLAALKDSRPDLVITDIFMPEMDGLEVIRAIRAECPGIAIIALSGGGSRNNYEPLELAWKLGAKVVLRKPASRAQLLDAVQTCLLISGEKG